MIEKKKSGLGLERNRTAFFSAGLILVSSLALAAFEWKTLTVQTDYSVKIEDEEVHMIEEEIITELPEPPKPKMIVPPKIQQPTVSETIQIREDFVPDETAIVDELPDEELPDIDIEGDDVSGSYIVETIEREHRFVETMPEFPGGEAELFKFIKENVEYPWNARELGEQGTAYIEFTIEKDGSISRVQALRPIFDELNDEAIRVIKAMPNWKPGEQRGRKVRVRYTIPINFVLNK